MKVFHFDLKGQQDMTWFIDRFGLLEEPCYPAKTNPKTTADPVAQRTPPVGIQKKNLLCHSAQPLQHLTL